MWTATPQPRYWSERNQAKSHRASLGKCSAADHQIRVGQSGRKVAQVVCALFLAATASSVFAGAGTDERIGEPGVYYVDPEFHAPTRHMAWQDFNSNDVWICQIDAQTGRLIPANGKGIRPPVKTVSIFKSSQGSGSFNGPELGFSTRGLFAYYTIRDGNGVNQTARFGPLDRGTPTYLQISRDERFGRAGALPTILPDFPEVALLNIYLDRLRGQTGWSFEDTPNDKNIVPTAEISLKGPRWVPGELAISTNIQTSDRTKQAAIYDVETGTTKVITNDAGHKTEVFVFNCPETGTRAAMCLVGNAQRELAVYKEASPYWEKIASIPCPTFVVGGGIFGARIYLPEPFVFQGKSYFTFVVGKVNTRTLAVKGPSQVFVAQLGRPEAVQIGSTNAAARLDPEALVLSDRVYLYYYIGVAEGSNMQPELHVVKDFLPLP
ncbi:MAG: hypothetical protein KF777_14155 [Planctomycetaceae bacterium]|nr:hypothetical protein [Planctomycetaceae bacterium]